MYMYMYIYIYIHIHVFIIIIICIIIIIIIIIIIHVCYVRRRENMVGVNMVLAEYNRIQTRSSWIYLLLAICECFDGILLKPCLLQPCFHVAGMWTLR